MATGVGVRIEVTGVVQGVGFRPFVHRLATELGLDGAVGNDSTRVFIEAFGTTGNIDLFIARLQAEAPPLAQIDSVTTSRLEAPAGRTVRGFAIVESRLSAGPKTLIPPDTAVCDDCRRELRDPTDRRYGHPFITCTNCGPRFTIITSLPYDRPCTTMVGFAMCARCEAEYDDPADRRYHAQPIACHDCGPTLELRAHGSLVEGSPTDGATAIIGAAALLAEHATVAIKGLGGYHLSCDATDDDAVARLRTAKSRPDKPFAVMVASIDQARELAELDEADAELLSSPEAPIVLARARAASPLSPLVAPGNPMVGLMVAYTPVHILLLAEIGRPLVMTSANRAGEPLTHDAPGIDRLRDLYDAVLDHNRPIHVPCDDSVVRVLSDRGVGNRLLPVRRARGYAPMPVPLPGARRSVLAVGGELKNTFCVVADGHAWVSQHVGDMANLETLQAFERSSAQLLEMYAVEPEVVAADAHPGYLSSNWARANYPEHLIEIQHHHAHVAAVMAEHRLDPTESVLGFAFDGTGYGPDGTIWGGEVLVAGADSYERAAHLEPMFLPGGDAAIRNPCRVALAHLHAARIEWTDDLAPLRQLSPIDQEVLRRQLERRVGGVDTTSMGRLFDAVASLLDLRHEISFEAQAAIELEIRAEPGAGQADRVTNPYRFEVLDGVISPRPVLESIVADLAVGIEAGIIAWRFHEGVADVVAGVAEVERASRGIATVALSGGVFQNVLLTRLCVERLENSGFTVVTHSLVPPNDGGLALGQAYIAAHSQRYETKQSESEQSESE